jgi:DNA-3-methyladenine glycosylase
MHYCFNVVTGTTKTPEAVLIRALEPLEGQEQMMSWRQTDVLKNLTTGPAKLCEALNIDKKLNAKDLRGDELFVEEGPDIAPRNIVKRPRINIGYAEEAVPWPLRFYIKNNPYISRK